MTNFELLKVFQGPIKMLIRCNLRLDDCRYLELYEDYLAMVEAGDKVTYVVAKMAEKYNISQRKVYLLINRMGRDCTADAVNVPQKMLTT